MTQADDATRRLDMQGYGSWLQLMWSPQDVPQISRFQAIDASMPHLAAAISDFPGQQTVLIRLLRVLEQSLTTLLDRTITPHGFSEASLHTLMLTSCLDEQDISAGLLCDLVAQTPQNMTRILRALTDEGLIERDTDPADGRRSRIRITDSGRRRLAEVLPTTVPAVSSSFDGLTAEEQQVFELLLRKAIVSLDNAAVSHTLRRRRR